MKPGIKTSEFYMTVLSAVGSVAAAGAGLVDPKWAIILTTVSTIAYTISRGFTKQGQ